MSNFNLKTLYDTLSNILSSLEPGIESARELDIEMTDLKLSTNATSKELKNFYYNSTETAKQLGKSTKEIMSQTNEWARLGYSIKEASALAKNSIILESISPGLDISTATESLSNTLKSFSLDADDALDGIISKINVIGNTGTLNNSDIAAVLNSSSDAMSKANNTLEETIALSIAASQATSDTSLIGSTLISTAANIPEKGSEISSLTQTAFSPDGVNLFTSADNNTFKSTYQILSDIASVWNSMDTENREQLVESLAGEENSEILSSIIANFDMASNSITLMAGSSGSAMQSMNEVYDSLDYKLNTLAETSTGIAQNLFGGNEIKTVVDGLNMVGNAVEWITGKIGLIGTASAGIGLFAGSKNAGRAQC